MTDADPGACVREPESRSDTAAPSSPVLLWAAWLGAAAMLAWLIRLRTEPDVDLWLHLRIGAELREGERFGSLPDPLTALADVPYVPSQWLPEVVGSVVEQAGGISAIHLLRGLGVLALLLLSYRTARIWARPVGSGVIALPVTVATAAGWGERPQLLGLVLLAASLLLWSLTMSDGRPRWSLVPLTWLWACSHGSWALGAAVGALTLVVLALDHSRPPLRWPPLLALVAALGVVPALTPLGPSLVVEPFRVSAAARGNVNEWQVPSPGNPLLLLVVLLALVVLVRAVRARDLTAAGFAVLGVALAGSSTRTIAVGALFLVPALARTARSGAPARSSRREWVPAVVAGLVLLGVPGVVWGSPVQGPLGRGVDDAVAALPAGSRVAVDAFASGWVLWAHPDVTPLRDLRVEAYSSPVAASYERFFGAGDGWQTYAGDQRVQALLVRAREPLDVAAASDPGWRRTADDGRFVLWVRAAP